jgi:hypothetical protein
MEIILLISLMILKEQLWTQRSSVNTGDAFSYSGTQGYVASSYSGWQNAIAVGHTVKANTVNAISGNTIYGFRFIVVGVSLTGKRLSSDFETEQVSTSYTDTGGRTSGYIGLRVNGIGSGHRVTYYDWIRVRKYVSPEPSFISAGSLERRSSIIPFIL